MSAPLRGLFETEAGESLAALRRLAAEPAADIAGFRAAARLLRGSALLAGEPRVHAVAAALAAGLGATAAAADPRFRARVAATVEDVELLLRAAAPDTELEARTRAAEDRWGGPPAAADPSGSASGETDSNAFLAREVSGLADTLEEAVQAFQADPHDREWLATVLRRQRPLAGSVRTESVPVVTESLEALEDLVALILALDVPVKAEWLDIFRSARDVFRSACAALGSGAAPSPVPALSRLRTLRDELLSRYGARDAEPAFEPESGES